MCGISGILNPFGKLSVEQLAVLARKMADTMVHRGPDDSGVWVEKSGAVALSQRRLSIIDTSSAGRNPFDSWDGRFTITFNGEIYNFAELKPELEKRGCKFKGRTDTEVLVEAIRIFGEDVFKHLDGMYAFAIYDREAGSTLIGRDPFGEKPLYYTETGGYLAFASELHALPLLPGFDCAVDLESIAQYLAFQYVPAPRTIYRSAKKLLPGHYLAMSADGKVKIGRHFSFEPWSEPEENRSIDELADELEDILVRSTRRRLMSDVPLGAFLSGGVDSSTVAALISKVLGVKLKTFSIGFDDSPESEHLQAREMALHLGTDHHDKILEPNAIELSRLIGTVLDEPNSDSSCLPTYLLTQFARKQVTVTLSGDGGDEMFGGYGRYFETLAEVEAGKAGVDSNVRSPGNAYFSERLFVFSEPYLERFLGGIPPETKELISRLKAEIDDSSIPLLSRMRSIDVRYYMPGAVLAKVDRMSMQHSMEVRCPILSREVAAFAERIAPNHCVKNGQGKLVLKQLAARYIPRAWLERPKRGFGTPTSTWGRDDYLKQLRKRALGFGSRTRRFVGGKLVKQFVDDQSKPNQFSPYQTWAVLILEQWLRSHKADFSRDSIPRLTIHEPHRPDQQSSELLREAV